MLLPSRPESPRYRGEASLSPGGGEDMNTQVLTRPLKRDSSNQILTLDSVSFQGARSTRHHIVEAPHD